MAAQTLTISPGSVKAWILGSCERAVDAKPIPREQKQDTSDSYPPFDQLSAKAKAQVLVEVAGQLRVGLPSVVHQMSVIHQRRLTAVSADLDSWLDRIAIALEPVSAKGESAVPKVADAIRAERPEGLMIIDQLQWNIPTWGLTRGLQTFLRGCDSL
ncbi:MAG: hypothetical protein ACR2RV_29020 [Verrucomicrobiales bacterium]